MFNVSASEMRVLEVLWQSNVSMSAAQINQILKADGGIWADKTVATFLKRLEEKGVTKCEKIKRALYFQPTVTKEEYREKETKAFIDKQFDGSLVDFVSTLVHKDKLTEYELSCIKEWVDTLND